MILIQHRPPFLLISSNHYTLTEEPHIQSLKFNIFTKEIYRLDSKAHTLCWKQKHYASIDID